MKCHSGTSILRLYLLLRCIHTLQQPLSWSVSLISFYLSKTYKYLHNL